MMNLPNSKCGSKESININHVNGSSYMILILIACCYKTNIIMSFMSKSTIRVELKIMKILVYQIEKSYDLSIILRFFIYLI